MTDEEKLRVSVEAFKNKLDTIETWDQFKNLIGNLTKTQIKNFLKNKLAEYRDGYLSGAEANTAAAGELDDLIGEYDNV